ncbi:MAG: hypothetical protein EPO47_00420 [Rugosibacter sp.]|nr:MAG: hypothetical protein EPO60_03575 [Rugosibacter sp.]TBR12134.1 MAG: hypothetical protein EPO47_00420 [Rugosibacter sp.]
MLQTKHATARAQQRAIPPLVDRLLEEFGDEEYDGHGCILLYFSHRSVREMERCLGRHPVGLMKRYLDAYKVESCEDGATVTKGWRTSKIRRK